MHAHLKSSEFPEHVNDKFVLNGCKLLLVENMHFLHHLVQCDMLYSWWNIYTKIN